MMFIAVATTTTATGTTTTSSTTANRQMVKRFMAKAGTPHYMSPEMHSKAWYSYTSDIFACGIILYQMLSGDHPFFTPRKDTAASL